MHCGGSWVLRSSEAMRITFELPEADLQDLIRFTGSATVQEATLTAVREFNRRRRIATLARHAGQGDGPDDAEFLQQGRRDRCP